MSSAGSGLPVSERLTVPHSLNLLLILTWVFSEYGNILKGRSEKLMAGIACLFIYSFFLLLLFDEHCFWAECRECKPYKTVPVSLFNLRGQYILMRDLFRDPEPETGCCFRFYFSEITCHLRSWLRWCHLHLNSVRGIQESCHHT